MSGRAGPAWRRPAAALLLAAAAGAHAAADPRWEVGAVALGVDQQAYPGASDRVRRGLLLPYFIYRGDVLRADREGAGLRAFRSRDLELDVSAAAAFGASATDVPARRGLEPLGTMVEVGPRLRWTLAGTRERGRWRLDLPLRAVFDLEHQLAHRGFVLQPGVAWDREGAAGWTINLTAGALLGDRRLASTYYGVPAAAALPGRPAYEARAGLVAWRLGATLSRPLGRDRRAFGFARIDSVAGAANRASPLVTQQTGATLGLGVAYTWLRSAAVAVD
jgi:outer membrane scaffolding protein for murein synthesis (MipA/OmpV family)